MGSTIAKADAMQPLPENVVHCATLRLVSVATLSNVSIQRYVRFSSITFVL